MRLRGGGGGGGEGLSLAICMMSSMQEGNGGGAFGKPLCRAYGEGKTAAAAKKKFGARHPHFHGDKLRRRSANERARFPE